jgi:hypothetical protein
VSGGVVLMFGSPLGVPVRSWGIWCYLEGILMDAVKKIIVVLSEGRRLVVHPEGGMGLEVYVHGVGWVVGTDDDCSDTWAMRAIFQAADMLVALGRDMQDAPAYELGGEG